MLAVAACTLDIPGGQQRCSPAGECAPGYHCAVDKTCWRDGQDPSLGGDSDAAAEDLAGADQSAGAVDLAGADLAGDLHTPPDLVVGGPDLTADLVGKLPLGQACTSRAQCATSCADGVCCENDCTGACTSCNQVGNLGRCMPIVAGSDPAAHGSCATDPQMSCGLDGKCDGVGHCRFWGMTVVCKTGGCDVPTGLLTPDSRCDGLGACATPTAVPCDPYVCKGDGTACATTCSTGADCKAPNPCSMGSCGPKSAGQSCVADTECQSTHCTDGVCCDKPASTCSGCQACNLAASMGTCKPVPTGQDPRNVCGADPTTCAAGGCNGAGACTPSPMGLVCATSCTGATLAVARCTGTALGCPAPTSAPCADLLLCATATSCRTTCTVDGDCVSGNFCNLDGTCKTTRPNGRTCSGGGDCTSGNCVDGTCCDKTLAMCSGCQACNVASKLGTCSPVPAGTDPHAACTANVATCTAGGCNGAGACTPSPAGGVCACSGTATTSVCNGTTTTCPAATSVCAGSLLCATTTSCKTTCSNNGDCTGGKTCSAGVCGTLLSDGMPCGAGAQCQSSLCVDGYCCNAACGGQCQACNVVSNLGVCTTVTSGAPHGTRAACSGTGACQGSCDGSSATACGFPAVQCAAASCVGSTSCQAASCATGACPSQSCAACANGLVCASSTACKTTCAADADCVTGYFCSTAACAAKKASGNTCSGGNQCTSGSCVDGYCCNAACAGQCQACDVAGSEGACVTVTSGQPHGVRGACSGGGGCQGTCNGSSPTACTFPTSQCAAVSCSGSTLCQPASCSGGSCPSPSCASCANQLVCATATTCRSSCSLDSHCVSGYYCSASTCTLKKSSGSTCTAGNQCSSNNCVDGYCCNSTCTSKCQACDIANKLGVCSTVTSGQPHGWRTACSGTGGCQGTCNGSSSTACTFPTSQCAAVSCSGSTVCQASSCSSGSCPSQSCAACANRYVCASATACKTSCTVDGDCVSGFRCLGDLCGKRIFKTDSPIFGNVGSVAAADSRCASDAAKPSTGTYKALIVDGTTRIAAGGSGQLDWVLQPSTAYMRPDGTLIGTTNSSALFTFPLTNSFVGASSLYWTGLYYDWTTYSVWTCSGWTSTSGSGATGYGTSTTSNAINNQGTGCTGGLNLLCVEQ